MAPQAAAEGRSSETGPLVRDSALDSSPTQIVYHRGRLGGPLFVLGWRRTPYCQLYCQRRGLGGVQGHRWWRIINNLLIWLAFYRVLIPPYVGSNPATPAKSRSASISEVEQ